MALGLDLSASRAKVDRADEGLRILQEQLPAHIVKNSPYSVRFSEIDPQTGWCEVFLVPENRGDHGFGILFGEAIHNLRSALDYIVTALCKASMTQLTTKHQFPIYRDDGRYLKDIGPIGTPNPKGALGGLTVGDGLIESWQPYKLKTQGLDPRVDPLWHIHRFSNADKHREVSAYLPIPFGQLNFAFNGTKVEDDPVTDLLPTWSPDEELMIHRMRFDPPVAQNLHVTGGINIAPGFSVPAFNAEPIHSVALHGFDDVCSHVTKLLDTFEQL